jgi:hypothetical protein
MCQLIETLLTQERLKTIVASLDWPQRIRNRFFEPGSDNFRTTLDPAHLFPNAGEPTQREISQWLRDLLSDRSDDALARFDSILGMLVEAAQLETLVEEIPNVIDDAIGEQDEWNQFQVEVAQKASAIAGAASNGLPWVFRGPSHRLDPFVAVAGAAQIMRDRIKDFAQSSGTPATPRDTPLGRFFTGPYKVGAETLLRDIPTQVLLQMLATTLLVTLRCVLGLLGPDLAQRVRSHPVYRFGVELPLRAFYAFTIALRSPGTLLATLGALLLVSVTLLVVGLFFFGTLIWTSSGVSGIGLLIFIFAPVLVIFACCIVAVSLWWPRKRDISMREFCSARQPCAAVWQTSSWFRRIASHSWPSERPPPTRIPPKLAYMGRPALPPPWAFGLWISADIWRSGGEVRYAVTQFRDRGIPASAFVFDSPWETAYNDFQFNMTQFGNDACARAEPRAIRQFR